MPPCAECGAITVWDDDAASQICTLCGTLVDASQSILTSVPDSAPHLVPSTTLKSFRLGSNWDLAGQGKEARDRRNSYAMAEYIRSLATSLNASGLSPRVIALFTQAKARAHFRWGRKAKLVAGACLAIALREAHRPDALHDIAFLLTDKFSTLVRTLVSITSLLNLSLTPSNPTFHIPGLTNFLSCLLLEDDTHLPRPLSTQLRSLCLRSATNTATSLSNLLARLGPSHPINQLPSPPTACALLLLALEAQLRTPLTHLGDLAQCLGARCHVGRTVVMERYKSVQDEINVWIERVPWLTKYERPRGKPNCRAKIGKRTIVALGLHDVLQFQDEIWKGQLKPTIVLETSDDELDTLSDSDITPPPIALIDPQPSLDAPQVKPTKRQKTIHKPLHEATRFLLHPLSAPVPSSDPPPTAPTHPSAEHNLLTSPSALRRNLRHTTTQTHKPPSRRPRQGRPPSLALASYILTAPSLSFNAPNIQTPTRLQMLVAQRGGVNAITDDELFAPGELEELLRSDEDAAELHARYIQLEIWDEHEPEEGEHTKTGKNNNRGKRKRGSEIDVARSDEGQGEQASHGRKRGRVDLEALARFLRDPVPLASGEDDKDADDAMFLGLERFDDEGEEEDYVEDDKDEYHDYEARRRIPVPATSIGHIDGEVIVDEWRPLSPEAGFSTHAGGYEEEYD